LKPLEMKKAISNAIGTKPLRELARNKKEVVILFDDMARVTRIDRIVPHVLGELAAAGVPSKISASSVPAAAMGL